MLEVNFEKVIMGDVINIYYKDGKVERDVAVTGWMPSKYNNPQYLESKNIIRIEVVKNES